MDSKKINPSPLFVFLSLAVFAFIIFFSRQVFYYRYEPEYYENWFYQSQWNVPQSTRGISDGELYKFVGYRLIQGENPFNINYEVPPFAKSLYGLAEYLFANPYWVSLAIYLLILVSLHLFSRHLFPAHLTALLVVFTFLTNPSTATQIKETMLDLPLTLFFLIHTFFLLKFFSRPHLPFLIISGIFLGLATGTKIGIFSPLIIIIGLALLFVSCRRLLNLLIYLSSIAFGYVVAFWTYFIHHPNPIPWIRLHQKPINFYLNSFGTVDYSQVWRYIFTVRIFDRDWSPLLPLGAIVALFALLVAFKKKNWSQLYLSLVIITFLIVNTFIPFYSRYLMPIIPLSIILVTLFFRKYHRLLLILLALFNLPLLYKTMVDFRIDGDVQAMARFYSTRAYRELYRSLDPHQRYQISESEFIAPHEYFWQTLGIRRVDIDILNISQDNRQAVIDSRLTYLTRYGPIVHHPKFEFTRVNNQWRLNWRWDYIWSKFNPDSQIVISQPDFPINTVTDDRSNVLARKSSWHEVYVIPRLMYNWNQYLDALSQVTQKSTTEVDQTIKLFVPDDHPRFVGYLDPRLGSLPNPIPSDLLPGIRLHPSLYLVAPLGSKYNPLLVGMVEQQIYTTLDYPHLTANITLNNSNGSWPITTSVSPVQSIR